MNPRIPVATDDLLHPTAKDLLGQVERALGMAPNLHRTLAHSPAALRAYHDASRHLAGGKLSPRLREQIAIAVAGANQCGYCAAAHTTLGRTTGLDDAEMTCNLRGESADAAAAAVLAFARDLLDYRGRVDDASLARLRATGLDDADIVEIVAHVGLNVFTNYFNHVARTAIDFPQVELPTTEAAR